MLFGPLVLRYALRLRLHVEQHGIGHPLLAVAHIAARAVQANRSWIGGITEWVMEPAAGNFSGIFKGTKYDLGLNNRGNAAHIVVYDRQRQILEEEVISPLVVLAMRNMYQSTFGILMKATGMYKGLNVRPLVLVRRSCVVLCCA